MNPLLEALDHLLAAALSAAPAGGAPRGPVALSAVTLEPDGFRIAVRIGADGSGGECLLRGRIEGEHAGRQRVHLTCERLPEALPDALAVFRPLLETARITIELDFRPEPVIA